jgi:hypothetical protein
VGRRSGLRFMVVPGHGQGELFVDGHRQVYTKILCTMAPFYLRLGDL